MKDKQTKTGKTLLFVAMMLGLITGILSMAGNKIAFPLLLMVCLAYYIYDEL